MAVDISSIVNNYKKELDALSEKIDKVEELTVEQTNQAMADALGNALQKFIDTAQVVIEPITITNANGLALIDPSSGAPVTGTVIVPTHTEVIT